MTRRWHRMAEAAGLSSLVLIAVVGSLPAQEQATPLRPGTRVRVTIPCEAAPRPAAPPGALCPVTGQLVNARADSLRIARDGATTGYSWSAVRRLEVSRGHRGHRLAGAAAGLLVGGGVSYLVLHSGGSTSLCDRSANQDAMSASECLGLTAAGALVGAGLGAILGGVIRSERWQEVSTEPVRIGLLPGSSPRIVLSIAF